MTNSFQRSHMSTKSQGAKQISTQSPQQYNVSRNELKAGQDTHSNSIVQYGTPFQYTPNGTVHYGVPRQVLGAQYGQQFVASRYIQPYYAPQFYGPTHAQTYGNIISSVAATDVHHPSFQTPSPQHTIGTFNQAIQRNLVQIAQNNQVLAQYNLQQSFIQQNPYNVMYTGYPSPITTRGSYISPVAVNAIPTANHIYPKHYHWQNSVMSPPSIPQVIYHHPSSVSHHHIGFHQPAAIKCLPQTPPTSSNSQSPLNNLQELQTEIKSIEENSELQDKLNSVSKPKSFSNNQMDVFRAQIIAYTMLAQNQKINDPLFKTLNMVAPRNSNESSPRKVLYPNSMESSSQITPTDDSGIVTINGRQTA